MLRQQADQETNTEACYQAALLYIDGVGVEANFRTNNQTNKQSINQSINQSNNKTIKQ